MLLRDATRLSTLETLVALVAFAAALAWALSGCGGVPPHALTSGDVGLSSVANVASICAG
jgi:hypothetical protein